jgi:hypothetical protein
LYFFAGEFNFFIAWGRNATPETLQSGGNRSGDGQISFEVEVSHEGESQEVQNEVEDEGERQEGSRQDHDEGQETGCEESAEDSCQEKAESGIHEASSSR